MSERLPKLTQLRALEAAVRYGSINAAASALGVAQPSLSRSIRELEETLHVQLLVRGTSGVTLTEAGASFAENTSLILRALDRARDEAVFLGGRSGTEVSIGISPITTRSILVPALSSLAREFPLCRYHVEEGPLERHAEQLRRGVLDFAIGNADAEVAFGDFVSEPLFECPFFFVCAKGSPYEKARKLSDLEGARWWVTGEHRVMERKDLRFRTLSMEGSLSTRSNTVGIPMILRHGYLALLSQVQIHTFRDQVSVIPIEGCPVIGRYTLIRLKDVPLTSAAQRLIVLMQREAHGYRWSER